MMCFLRVSRQQPMLEHIDAEFTGSRDPVANLHEMHQDSVFRALDGEQAGEHSGDEADEPIIQEQTEMPQSQRLTGARTARRDE